jgi:hypothetical protein
MHLDAPHPHETHAETKTKISLLGDRAIRFPIMVRTPRLSRRIFAVIDALAAQDLSRAGRLVRELAAMPSLEVGDRSSDEHQTAPTLRAKALTRVLLDLAKNGWSVSLDDGHVYVTAPPWHAGGKGLSPEEIFREKERIRQSMEPRVREQLERHSTRSFIYAVEGAHHTAEGQRSVLNLMADGKALAASLKERGPGAVRPYLDVADGDAGLDPHSGILRSDLFRYFRYSWSFPMGSTPGRSVPFLIRDAGQPLHPVCGLISIASAVPRLTVRDTALGWTPAWLDAVVAGLSFEHEQAQEVLTTLEADLARDPHGPAPAAVFRDLASALELEADDASGLASAFRRMSRRAAAQRLRRARERLARACADEIESALSIISLDGFGLTHSQALKEPLRAAKRLAAVAQRARETFLRSRRLDGEGQAVTRAAVALEEGWTYAELSTTPLFRKKRAAQATKLLTAWAEIRTLGGPAGWECLVSLVHGPEARRYQSGAAVAGPLRTALAHLQSRFLASQVADVTVCGAVPPYGPLLGGKLAAMLVLSRGPANAYYRRYLRAESEISSQMAGRKVIRPASLVALTTTSFYGVGSSLYQRVQVSDSVRWRFAGYTRGHGTLHFSEATSDALLTMFEAETGMSLHTSTFGEGPSERLRKVRDGMARLGLDASDLLQHGAPRQAYVAELSPGATRPGATGRDQKWYAAGPSEEETAQRWRDRWLGPRLVRLPEIIDQTAAFNRTESLLSGRLSQSVPGSAPAQETE